jgi:peptide deformylase
MILKIVKYGEPVLARPTDQVTSFDRELRDLVDNMFETMYAAPGVGLAATQVGIGRRLFVMDCSTEKDKRQKIALINPVIESEEGEQIGQEGCLSVPGFYFDIKRPRKVVARGQDVDGNAVVLEARDLEARCVSHEVDHLDGKLLLVHLSPLKRDMVERKLKKKIKRGDW